MIQTRLIIVLTTLFAGPESEHAANPIYRAVRDEGLSVAGATALVPDPVLHDDQSADLQRAAMRRMAGSAEALDELLRNSVTAPFELKNRSVPYPGGIIRVVDLWFIVHADLEEIDLKALMGQVGSGRHTETGNMRFEARLLTAEELKARGIVPENDLDRYMHTTGRLLDRLGLEATNRSFATRSGESLVVASRTLAAFDKDAELPNRWWPITRRGSRDEPGAARPYAGGMSYAKVSKVKFKPGALLVEAHIAFDEPRAWFDGGATLRSKISLVAQDQIRQLRREIAKGRRPK